MDETIETYNKSALALAKYFQGIGSRVKDIEKALQLAGNPKQAIVVEIGCGDGRDAVEIVMRVGNYRGFDPSTGMLEIARKNVPSSTFEEADALTFEYGENLDVVFSFASLLHSPIEDVEKVFQKVAIALRPGGIVYLSLKESHTYEFSYREDEHGRRLFYYYTPKLIEELAGKDFEKVYEDHQIIGKGKWFTLALKRR